MSTAREDIELYFENRFDGYVCAALAGILAATVTRNLDLSLEPTFVARRAVEYARAAAAEALREVHRATDRAEQARRPR